jgi:Spy/CpxP family protein refolding chaperone
MKKTIAAALAAVMLTGMSAAVVTPASAAGYSYSMHPTVKIVVKHKKHWHQHLWCKTKWRHHHKVRVCIWVPNHH